MIAIFKKIFKELFTVEKIEVEEIEVRPLKDRLAYIAHHPKLDEALNDPVTDIYILSVYHNSFNDLMSGFSSPTKNNLVTAITYKNFTKGLDNKMSVTLKRLVKHLNKVSSNSKVESDLFELIILCEKVLGVKQ